MSYRPALAASIAVALLGVSLAQAQPAPTLSVPQLLRNLESDNVNIAASSARTLGVVFAPGGREGDDKATAVTKLIAHLDSQKGPEIRRQCAIALGSIRAAEAAEPMKKALADDEVEVVIAAGEAVAQILPVDDARAYLTEIGKGDAPLAKVGAYHGLATIAKPADAPFLLTGVGSDNWRAQQASVTGLERAVRAGATLEVDQYKAIASVLGADTTNASNAAVHFFTHVHNANAVAALEDAADPEAHPDNWRQRTMALRAIYHRHWPRNRAQLPLVIRNLGDKTVNVNNEALGILAHLRKERRVHTHTLMPILVSELERAKPLGRRAAIMRQMPHEIEPQYASRAAVVAAKTLTEAAKDEAEWPAHTQALRIIGATGYSGVMEDVAKSVGSNIADVRNAAGGALQRLGSICPPEQAAKVAPVLQPYLARAVDWRKGAVAAASVGAYANDETVDPLVDLLGHSVLNVRRGASRSLVIIASDAESPLRTEVDTAVHSLLAKNPASWQYGSPVLAALDDVKAVPLLTRILREGDWRSKESAAKAVQTLATRHKISDAPLNKALVAASQSEVLQVQKATDLALRELAKQAE